MRGRKPTPRAILDLQGTSRVDRHGSADAGWNPQEPPQQLARLTGEAAKFWDHLVSVFAESGVVALPDSAILVRMCRAWDMWLRLESEIEDSMDAKERRGLLRDAARVWNQFAALAVQCGMTPVGRERLKRVATVGDVEDPMDLLTPGRN